MANTTYSEHIEEYGTLSELQADIHYIIKRFKEIGNLDVQLDINLLNLTITVVSPEESDA